jgi:dTDP-4-amino-4,6-dideoxyglucose
MKHRQALAYFGGAPAFAQPLHVAQLNLPEWERIESRFRDIFRRHFFANNGPLVQALDVAFADYAGVEHAVSVTNGTLGLMILARALEISGEVIVPAFTFPATAQAVAWAGLTPVLADVLPASHMIAPKTVAPLLTRQTVGIIGVHVWGRPCDPDGLQAFAAERNLTLFYDACHAIGCTHRGRRIGGFGSGEVFSYHATQVLNAAEGGCITTNDPRLADRLRTMRNFSPGQTFASVPTRINGKMSEAQAALALLSLEDLPDNIAANCARHDWYAAGLAEIPGVDLVRYPDGEDSNFQYVVIEIDADRSGIDRDIVFDLLAAENVLCRRHFAPGLHQLPYFAARGAAARGNGYPVTDRLCATVMQLPTGGTLARSDVERICHLIRCIVGDAETIVARIGGRP